VGSILRLWGFCERCHGEFGATFDSFAELAEAAAAVSWRPLCTSCREVPAGLEAVARS
jgi:hypothetical protein